MVVRAVPLQQHVDLLVGHVHHRAVVQLAAMGYGMRMHQYVMCVSERVANRCVLVVTGHTHICDALNDTTGWWSHRVVLDGIPEHVLLRCLVAECLSRSLCVYIYICVCMYAVSIVVCDTPQYVPQSVN